MSPPPPARATSPASPPLPPAEALATLTPPDVELSTGVGLATDTGTVPGADTGTGPATGVGLRHPAAREVWYGIVWGRLGRADLAWAHWDRVDAAELQPWLAAEGGRVLRELGLHARAAALEEPALHHATDPVDAAMLAVSLAADAVGLGRPAQAQRRLEAARASVAALPDGPRAARQRLRLTWVGVEVAWLIGMRPSTEGLPTWGTSGGGQPARGGPGRGEPARGERARGAPVLPADHRWGSRFHTAKGLLFGGVVRDDLRLLDAAAELAPPALAWAVHLARADRGVAGAEAAARTAWARLVPPPGVTAEVAGTPTARRLSG